MNKALCMCLLLVTAVTFPAICLPKHADTILAVAKRDAKKFKLDDSTWKLTRKQRSPVTSDYFKPGKTNVKDTLLLQDSVYVNAFRRYAFKQNKRRRTAGHHILVGVEIAAGIAAAALIAIIIFVAPNME